MSVYLHMDIIFTDDSQLQKFSFQANYTNLDHVSAELLFCSESSLWEVKGILVLRAVTTIKIRDTRTEINDNTNIIAWAITPLTSCAYCAEANAKAVRGKE